MKKVYNLGARSYLLALNTFYISSIISCKFNSIMSLGFINFPTLCWNGLLSNIVNKICLKY